MGLKIDILDLGDVHLDSSFLVLFRSPGTWTTVRTVGYLITGGSEGPILVDTGYRNTKVMETIGMKGTINPGTGLEVELDKRGLKPSDIRYVIHTHLHIDHAGKTDLFPMNTTTVVFNRRELEIAAGYGGYGYYPDDTKHLIDRMFSPQAAMPLDLQESGPFEVVPGVVCELAGGHTPGSLNVLVETDEGIAYICGDVIYDFQDQIIMPSYQLQAREPKITGNYANSYVQEKGAIKKAMHSGTWVLPMHDAPAKVTKGGIVVGRVWGTQVPGEVSPVDDKPTDLQQGTSIYNRNKATSSVAD